MVDKINSNKIITHIFVYLSIFLIFAGISVLDVIAFNKEIPILNQNSEVANHEWVESSFEYWNSQFEINRGESGPVMFPDAPNNPNDYPIGYALKVNMYEQVFDGVNVESIYVGSYYWVVKNK